MDKFDGYKQQLEQDLKDDTKPWTKYLKLAEEKTGVNRLYIFFGEFNNCTTDFSPTQQDKTEYFSLEIAVEERSLISDWSQRFQGYQSEVFFLLFAKLLYNQSVLCE